MNDTKFCSNCGAENRINASFCRNCGSKLETIEVPAQESLNAEAEQVQVAFQEIADAHEQAQESGSPDKVVTPAEPVETTSTNAFEVIADMPEAPETSDVPNPLDQMFDSIPAAPISFDNTIAQELPEWDILPPNTLVKRKKK